MTAYEMRISDWSSDVCSSDLALLLVHVELEPAALLHRVAQLAEGVGQLDAAGEQLEPFRQPRIARLRAGQRRLGNRIVVEDGRPAVADRRLAPFRHPPARSDEHTSVPQSLIRLP